MLQLISLIKTAKHVRAAFQLSVFYTYVHARKSLNSSKQFVFNK